MCSQQQAQKKTLHQNKAHTYGFDITRYTYNNMYKPMKHIKEEKFKNKIETMFSEITSLKIELQSHRLNNT